MPHMSKASFSA